MLTCRAILVSAAPPHHPLIQLFDRFGSECFALDDQIVPSLPAGSISEEVRAAMIVDILGHLLPGDLRGGEVFAFGELVDRFLQEVYLILSATTFIHSLATKFQVRGGSL